VDRYGQVLNLLDQPTKLLNRGKDSMIAFIIAFDFLIGKIDRPKVIGTTWNHRLLDLQHQLMSCCNQDI
jgi:hypothetical protein